MAMELRTQTAFNWSENTSPFRCNGELQLEHLVEILPSRHVLQLIWHFSHFPVTALPKSPGPHLRTQ